MKQASRIVALVSALTGSAMFGSDQILPLFNIKGLPPSFAQYWPVALFIAMLVHQAAGIVNTWLRDQQFESAAGPQPSNPNPVTKSPLPAIAAVALISTVVLLVGCAQFETENAKLQADIQKGLQWASSPQGQQFLKAVDATVQIVAANGGMKSKANAANVSTALRSLEGGSLPSPNVLASTIATYTGSNSTAAQLVGPILATIQAAPSTTGGLEATAQKLDAISASTPAKLTYFHPLDDIYTICALHFVNYRHSVALR